MSLVSMNKAAMNSFDLRKVRELMSFQDLFRTDSSYMPEAKCLNRVELDAEPLYEIVTKTEVLFTAKLLYYRLLVANEVNRHINDATKLLDEDSTGYLAQYLLKNTFEAVQTLMHEANDRLAEVDCGDVLWQDITSTSPRIEASVRGRMEETVFIHDVFAELARCWLELQDRFENTSNGIGSYTAALLYSSCISRMPDEEFKVARTEARVDVQLSVDDDHPSEEDQWDTVIERLTPFFYNDRNEAKAYLEVIKNMSSNPEKVKYTAKMVKEDKLSDMRVNRPIWKILHDCGLYKPSESNWNIDIKKYR